MRSAHGWSGGRVAGRYSVQKHPISKTQQILHCGDAMRTFAGEIRMMILAMLVLMMHNVVGQSGLWALDDVPHCLTFVWGSTTMEARICCIVEASWALSMTNYWLFRDSMLRTLFLLLSHTLKGNVRKKSTYSWCPKNVLIASLIFRFSLWKGNGVVGCWATSWTDGQIVTVCQNNSSTTGRCSELRRNQEYSKFFSGC